VSWTEQLTTDGVGTAGDYREASPPRPLAGHVACFWTLSTGDRAGALPQRVLPDGCIDIVWLGEEAPLVAGPATRARLHRLPARTIVAGVRFRPGVAPSLLGPQASELLNAEVPLRDVRPVGWGGKEEGLAAGVGEAETREAKLAAVGAVVAYRLAVAGPADDLVSAAVATLARQPAARVDEVSRLSRLSARQLQRRFEAAVGYGPKTLQRILRFQRWLRLVEQTGRNGAAGAGSGSGPGLAQSAVLAGYADQAHLTREVTRLAGVSPRALLADAGARSVRVGLDDAWMGLIFSGPAG
jgi:AraC-like DNA-binding protein